jgi:hypothetical protein
LQPEEAGLRPDELLEESLLPVLRDFDFAFDPTAVLKRLGGAKVEGPERQQALLRMFEAAVAEARELIHPAIAYAVHPVVRAEAGRLIVGDGSALESAVLASLFAEAPEVVLMIYTIGPKLEERVAEYGKANEVVAGFALDLMGSIAVDQVGVVGYGLIEGMARERGVKASIPLNPGTSHWPMSGQRVIAGLVPAQEIGVEVLDSGLLRPFKTIAFAVGLGSNVLTPAEGSSCDYCETRDLCRW